MIKNKEIKNKDITFFSKKLKISPSSIKTLLDNHEDQELFLSVIANKVKPENLKNLSFQCALKIFIYQTLSKFKKLDEKKKIFISDKIINTLINNIKNKEKLEPVIIYSKNLDAAFSNIISCGLMGSDFGTPHLYTIYLGLDKLLTVDELSNWMLDLYSFNNRINSFLVDSLKESV